MTGINKVWRAIKRRPGIGVKALSLDTGLSIAQVWHATQRLLVKGQATKVIVASNGHAKSRYTAVKGIKRPPDARGLHPNCMANLVLGIPFAHKRVRRIAFAPVPPCGTELGRCWQMPQRISDVAETVNLCDIAKAGHSARPEFDEAA